MMSIKNFLKSTIFYPFVVIKRRYENYLAENNPQKLMKMRYRSNMGGVRLNLENPKSLDDKVNYMSFNTDTALWSELADKVLVRDYVTQCGFPEVLNEIYAVYRKADEIDFSKLPEQFVMKTNHASATNIFVKDKSKVSEQETKEKFREWLNTDYGLKTATPHYSRIKPMILVEKMLVEDNDPKKALTDYKIYCFHGVPKYIFVFSDRVENTHTFSKMIYDTDWNAHPEYLNKGLAVGKIIPRPESFDKMMTMAGKLSEPFPFVRVDFYEIDNEPVFSELTFTPGHNSAASPAFLRTMGDDIKI